MAKGAVVEALAGAARRLGIGLVEVADDGLDRAVQAVQVEAVEARGALRALVVLAQPLDELEHHRVPPHPAREAAEVSERRVRVPTGATDVAVRAVGIRPVGLGGDRAEPAVGEQPLRHLRTQGVELVRPVRRLADQHEARGRGPLEQRLDAVRERERAHAGIAS
jgi:hypothetical protein